MKNPNKIRFTISLPNDCTDVLWNEEPAEKPVNTSQEDCGPRDQTDATDILAKPVP